MRIAAIALVLLLGAVVGACKDMPGADGRYATHDHGALNRGNASPGLPVTPYNAN